MNESSIVKLNDLEQITWLVQAKGGDNQAFGKIVETYQRSVYNLCLRMLNDAGEAEDASQETFLRAYTRLESYDDSRLFSTWLFSIASHYCLDLLRKRQVRFNGWHKLTASYSAIDDRSGPEKSYLRKELSHEIRTLLGSLPREQRAAVILKYWHAMSYDEIASSLNTTGAAIKSKLFRARRMLAQRAAEPAQPTVTPKALSLAAMLRA